jgi:hypothetical protein
MHTHGSKEPTLTSTFKHIYKAHFIILQNRSHTLQFLTISQTETETQKTHLYLNKTEKETVQTIY